MIWNVEVRKLLRHGASEFQVAVDFASDSPHLALFGPSGAGKSQVLKMIAGIVTPQSGRVLLQDRVLFDGGAGIDLRPQARHLGYVFQDYALFPHLSVQQNIEFSLRGGWFNPRRREATPSPEVRRWIDAFGLKAVADHYPHQISGGQRQRTALARALVNRPNALLLDEPFAALDSGLRQKLRRELRDLQAGINIPTLLITHDEEDLSVLANQVVCLKDGMVVQLR